MRNFPFIARMIVRLVSTPNETTKPTNIPADTSTGVRGVATVNSVMVKDRTNGIEKVMEDGHIHVVMNAPLYSNGKFDFDAAKGLPPYVVATFSTWVEYWMRMAGHRNVVHFSNVPPCPCEFSEPFDNIDDRWLD